MGSVKTDLPTPATDPVLVITNGAGVGELAAAGGDGGAAVLPDELQDADPPIARRARKAGASIVLVFMPGHYRGGLLASEDIAKPAFGSSGCPAKSCIPKRAR